MNVPLTLAILWIAILATHLGLSHPPVRSALVARLGAQGFRGLYSLVATVGFVALGYLWWTNRHAGTPLWTFRGPVAVHGAELLALLGFALTGAGVLRGSPSSMLGDYVPNTRRYEPRGILNVTRHPVNMGLALWGLSHVLVNGWPGDALFFGGFAALGILGAMHQDSRMSAANPEYAAMVQQTPLFPSPAGLRHLDRTSVVGLAAGAGVAVALRLLHDPLFR